MGIKLFGMVWYIPDFQTDINIGKKHCGGLARSPHQLRATTSRPHRPPTAADRKSDQSQTAFRHFAPAFGDCLRIPMPQLNPPSNL
jgi:hypothetical protein